MEPSSPQHQSPVDLDLKHELDASAHAKNESTVTIILENEDKENEAPPLEGGVIEWLPGAETGRVPPGWRAPLMCSGFTMGVVLGIVGVSVYEQWIAGAFDILLAATSVNYWREPEPGQRHNADLVAIALFFMWHLYLTIAEGCVAMAVMYALTPALLIAASLSAFNHCTNEPEGLLGWNRRDWSCALWMVGVHFGTMGITLGLYAQLETESCIVDV